MNSAQMPFQLSDSDRDDLARLCIFSLEAECDIDAAQRLIRSMNILPPEHARMLENWPWQMRIFSLGHFSVEINGKALEFSGKAPAKPLALLKALVAFGEVDVCKDKLAEAIWPDSDGDRARRALATTLHRLRQLVGPGLLVQSQSKISLSSSCCWSDLRGMDHYLSKARTCLKHDQLQDAWLLSEKALNFYRGSFHDSSSLGWELSISESIRRRVLIHIGELCSRLVDNRQYELAIGGYNKGLDIDDLQEGFYRGIITCHIKLGRYGEAHSVYRQCAAVLASFLGCMPSTETRTLLDKIPTVSQL